MNRYNKIKKIWIPIQLKEYLTESVFTSEPVEKFLGIKLSKKYKLPDGKNEHYWYDNIKDLMNKQFEIEDYKNVIDDIFNKFIKLNPELKKIKVKDEDDKYHVLQGVNSRYLPEDIDFFVKSSNHVDDKYENKVGKLINFLRQNIKDFKGFINPSPQTYDKIMQAIKHKNLLFEDLRLSDLKKHSGLSSFTTPFMQDRQKIKGAGNKSAHIVRMKVNLSKGYVTFVFYSAPTYEFTAQAVKLNSSDKGMKKAVWYVQEFRILDFFPLLKTKPGYKKRDVTVDDIKEVLKVASIQLSCNDPSFWWQGDAWVLTQFDASIYPCDIEPKHWRKYHNDDNYVCKHLSLILQNIEFFIPIMAGMINKYLNPK